MPKYFHFESKNNRDARNNVRFDGQLRTMRCEYILPSGHQCRRNCTIGLPYCFSHLPKEYQVEVKKSKIPNSGNGVFAIDKSKGNNDIIFRTNDEIIPYYGENVTRQELDRRYGHNNTAPYGIQKRNGFEDGALSRGIGTLVNHKARGANEALKNSRGTIVIKALKNIKNNEELYTNYGNNYKFNERNVKYSTNSNKKKI